MFFCLSASAQTQNIPAASSGTDTTTTAPKAVLASGAVDPAAAPQPAVQPRLAAQGQDTPAKKEEEHPGNGTDPKQEE